jgi:tungstate transport system ATP-binding protein
MTSALACSIRSLKHSYDGKVALDIPSLDIPAGQICAVIGPNGCGKTTLLSILALLLSPTSGSVLLDGVETVCSRDRNLRRKVTLVHQNPVLFSTSVRNNVAYGLRARGVNAIAIKRRVQAMIEEARLSEVAEKHARKISGGEAQRTVLARALVLETPVLLLDEPTNSLDDASRPIFSELLARANRARRTTIIIATHDTDFASSLSPRIIRLDAGKIAE